jgi:hypothetical protein
LISKQRDRQPIVHQCGDDIAVHHIVGGIAVNAQIDSEIERKPISATVENQRPMMLPSRNPPAGKPNIRGRLWAGLGYRAR